MDKFCWKIKYQGKAPSLNDWYSGKHWYKRMETKQHYGKIFEDLLEEAGVERMDKFQISILFNSRLDTDNVVGLSKILVDTMKGKYFTEDSKRFYRGLLIQPDESLPHNTYIISIYPL